MQNEQHKLNGHLSTIAKQNKQRESNSHNNIIKMQNEQHKPNSYLNTIAMQSGMSLINDANNHDNTDRAKTKSANSICNLDKWKIKRLTEKLATEHLRTQRLTLDNAVLKQRKTQTTCQAF